MLFLEWSLRIYLNVSFGAYLWLFELHDGFSAVQLTLDFLNRVVIPQSIQQIVIVLPVFLRSFPRIVQVRIVVFAPLFRRMARIVVRSASFLFHLFQLFLKFIAQNIYWLLNWFHWYYEICPIVYWEKIVISSSVFDRSFINLWETLHVEPFEVIMLGFHDIRLIIVMRLMGYIFIYVPKRWWIVKLCFFLDLLFLKAHFLFQLVIRSI